MGVGVAAAVVPAIVLATWWLAGPGLAVVGVVVGLRHHRPSPLGPWKVLLGALVLFWLGWTVSAGILTGRTAGLDPAALAVVRDLLYLAAYLGMGTTAALLVRHRTGGADRDSLIDALIVMVALAMVLWASLLADGGLAVGGLAGHERARIVFEPLVAAAVVGTGARLVFAGAARLPAAWLLLAASLLVLGGNLWVTRRVAETGATQAEGADVLWVLACAAVAAAALHPSMRRLTDRVTLTAQGIPLDRVALYGVALLIGPAVHFAAPAAAAGQVGLFSGAATLVVVLILWRVMRLLGEYERGRQALVATARRDSIVAAVGELALDERPLHQVLADADALVRHAIDGARCAVMPDGVSEIERQEVGEPELLLPVGDAHARVADVVAAGAGARSLSSAEREFLTTIATSLSAAARQRTAEARLRHQALHDELTGLPGRALTLDRLRHTLDRRQSRPVALLFVDLDGFKEINDTRGHETGDRVLIDVGERMRAAVRSHDTVARLAGDEFVVLVDDPDPLELRPLIARLHAAVASGGRLAPPADSSTLAASIGIAIGRAGEVTAEQMLIRADEAMYRAKRAGGARLAVCPHADPTLMNRAGLADLTGSDDEVTGPATVEAAAAPPSRERGKGGGRARDGRVAPVANQIVDGGAREPLKDPS